MKRIFILAFLLAWLTAQFATAAAVDTLAVRSASMDRDIPVIVILPDGLRLRIPARRSTCSTVTAAIRRRGSGSNRRCPPSPTAKESPSSVPTARRAGTSTAKVRAKSLYETFMTWELLPAVEERYPVSRDRSGRAITGLSMGGFGAVSLAIRHRGCSGPSAVRAAGWISARSPKTGRFRSCWARRPSIPKLGRRLRRST